MKPLLELSARLQQQTLIRLTEYRLEGSGWPSNADISFRFVVQPIGLDLDSSPRDQWIDCPSSSKLNFSTTGILQLFVNNVFVGMSNGINPVPVPRTNIQANFNTGYGVARVRYDILA